MNDHANKLQSIFQTFSGNLILSGYLGPEPHYKKFILKKYLQIIIMFSGITLITMMHTLLGQILLYKHQMVDI